MAKTILVPVDLKVPSLVTFRHAMDQVQAEKVTVILLYAEELSGSITDMLFYGPPKLLQKPDCAQFTEALEIIRNRYSEAILRVSFQVVHFNSVSYMRRWLATNRVTDIYVPAKYRLKCSGRAFDPVPVLRKSRLPLHEIEFDLPENKTDREHILSLFT